MGWLQRLFAPKPQATVPPQQEFVRLKVVGESFYQDALLAISHSTRGQEVSMECFAELMPEPTNRKDSNAVMVKIEGQCVGYLSRKDAVEWQPQLLALQAKNQPLMCHAFIGCLGEASGNPNLGVSLKLPVNYA